MKENRVIVITTVLNFFVAMLKLISGLTFSFSTLIADSIQSFIDFVTDITSLFANSIGKRRANKTYPFGYGQFFYLANLFTGVLLLGIGVFILCGFFLFDNKFVPDLRIAGVLFVVLILKLIVVLLLNYFGKSFKSELMIESAKESKADFISSCVVLIVLFVSFFEEYIPDFINIDKLGSLGMAIYVFYTSFKMIASNVNGILTNDVANDEIKDEILDVLKVFTKVKFTKVKVIKMSAYYSVFLQVKAPDTMSIRRFILLEKDIKSCLKKKNNLIRFIDIEPI